MTRQLWSISTLAVELGRDRRTIASALKASPPDGKMGGHDAWFLVTALAALQPAAPSADQLDPAQERARKDRALAVAAEIKNDIACGEVVPIDLVTHEISNMLSICRTRLLAIPSRVAGRFPGQNRAVLQERIMDGVCDALTELSSPEEFKIVKKARAAQAKAAARKRAA